MPFPHSLIQAECEKRDAEVMRLQGQVRQCAPSPLPALCRVRHPTSPTGRPLAHGLAQALLLPYHLWGQRAPSYHAQLRAVS